jgi:hypothetical protein
MITKSQAIRSLDPDSMFSIYEDVIKWDTPEISDAKINAEMARLQTEYDSNAICNELRAISLRSTSRTTRHAIPRHNE